MDQGNSPFDCQSDASSFLALASLMRMLRQDKDLDEVVQKAVLTERAAQRKQQEQKAGVKMLMVF